MILNVSSLALWSFLFLWFLASTWFVDPVSPSVLFWPFPLREKSNLFSPPSPGFTGLYTLAFWAQPPQCAITNRRYHSEPTAVLSMEQPFLPGHLLFLSPHDPSAQTISVTGSSCGVDNQSKFVFSFPGVPSSPLHSSRFFRSPMIRRKSG